MKAKIIVVVAIFAIALGAVGAAQAKGHSPLPTPINEY